MGHPYLGEAGVAVHRPFPAMEAGVAAYQPYPPFPGVGEVVVAYRPYPPFQGVEEEAEAYQPYPPCQGVEAEVGPLRPYPPCLALGAVVGPLRPCRPWLVRAGAGERWGTWGPLEGAEWRELQGTCRGAGEASWPWRRGRGRDGRRACIGQVPQRGVL